MSAERLVVVARPHDVSVAPVDAFVTRRHQVLEVLAQHFDLRLVLLRQPHDHAAPRADWADRVVSEISIPVLDSGRVARLRRSAGVPSPGEVPDEIGTAVLGTGAARAVTFGPWLREQFQPVFAALPTVHFFEEDLTRMHEIAPQSVQARLLRRVEAVVSSRRTPTPSAVVHISVLERAGAVAWYPRARHVWHPYLLPEVEWPVALAPPGSGGVLAVGNFREARNAEGLVDVLAAGRGKGLPPVQVISAAGLHDDLRLLQQQGRLQHVEHVESPYDGYRRARVTLVPARRVTGIKTTVLQAWAAGCPVVCFRASASSVGPWADSAARVGDTAEELVGHLLELLGDAAAAADLADRGRAVLAEHFDAPTRARQLVTLVRGLQR